MRGDPLRRISESIGRRAPDRGGSEPAHSASATAIARSCSHGSSRAEPEPLSRRPGHLTSTINRIAGTPHPGRVHPGPPRTAGSSCASDRPHRPMPWGMACQRRKSRAEPNRAARATAAHPGRCWDPHGHPVEQRHLLGRRVRGRERLAVDALPVLSQGSRGVPRRQGRDVLARPRRLSADAVPITMRSSLVQAQRLGADQRTRNRRLVRPSPYNDLQRRVAKAVPLHAASGRSAPLPQRGFRGGPSKAHPELSVPAHSSPLRRKSRCQPPTTTGTSRVPLLLPSPQRCRNT